MLGGSATAAGSSDRSTPPKSVSIDSVTQPVQLCFYNKCDCSIDIVWLDYQGEPRKYSTIKPNGSCAQSSFSTHRWIAEYEDGYSATYMGGNALLVLLPGGQLQVEPYQHNPEAYDTSWQSPAWGQYRQRGCVLDMPIMAYDCVCEEAVQQVVHVATHMLEGCCKTLLQCMVAAGCNIAIIGRNQVTTDIPPHHFMRSRSNCEDVRDIDGTTRGLGATCTVPSSSCAEENILMVDDRRYACENILIHELGHAVMNLGFDEQQLQRVHRCYCNAREQRLYEPGCYMMDNADEYWAEGCQSWFDATVRSDVNSGINTRQKLKAHDPQFAALLTEVFGDGCWLYPHTAPAALGHKPCSKKQRIEQQHQQLQEHQSQKHSQDKQQPVKQQGESRVCVQTRAMTAAAAVDQTSAQARLPAQHQDKAAASCPETTRTQHSGGNLLKRRAAG